MSAEINAIQGYGSNLNFSETQLLAPISHMRQNGAECVQVNDKVGCTVK